MQYLVLNVLIVVRNTFLMYSLFLIILLQKSSKLNEKNVQENSDFLKMTFIDFCNCVLFLGQGKVVK